MVINLGITITLVQKCGLVGVAIGTLLALAYRTCYLAYYLTHNILSYKIKSFLKCVLMDILIVVCTVYISYHFEINSMTYFSWFFYAIKVFLCTLVVSFVINYIFERQRIIGTIKSAINCRNF